MSALSSVQELLLHLINPGEASKKDLLAALDIIQPGSKEKLAKQDVTDLRNYFYPIWESMSDSQLMDFEVEFSAGDPAVKREIQERVEELSLVYQAKIDDLQRYLEETTAGIRAVIADPKTPPKDKQRLEKCLAQAEADAKEVETPNCALISPGDQLPPVAKSKFLVSRPWTVPSWTKDLINPDAIASKLMDGQNECHNSKYLLGKEQALLTLLEKTGQLPLKQLELLRYIEWLRSRPTREGGDDLKWVAQYPYVAGQKAFSLKFRKAPPDPDVALVLENTRAGNLAIMGPLLASQNKLF